MLESFDTEFKARSLLASMESYLKNEGTLKGDIQLAIDVQRLHAEFA